MLVKLTDGINLEIANSAVLDMIANNLGFPKDWQYLHYSDETGHLYRDNTYGEETVEEIAIISEEMVSLWMALMRLSEKLN